MSLTKQDKTDVEAIVLRVVTAVAVDIKAEVRQDIKQLERTLITKIDSNHTVTISHLLAVHKRVGDLQRSHDRLRESLHSATA